MKPVLKTVTKDKKGKLGLLPSFPSHGVYFYFIPEKYLPRVEEGKQFYFKYGPPKDTGKKDKRGKPIYQCAAIPQNVFVTGPEEEELNEI